MPTHPDDDIVARALAMTDDAPDEQTLIAVKQSAAKKMEVDQQLDAGIAAAEAADADPEIAKIRTECRDPKFGQPKFRTEQFKRVWRLLGRPESEHAARSDSAGYVLTALDTIRDGLRPVLLRLRDQQAKLNRREVPAVDYNRMDEAMKTDVQGLKDNIDQVHRHHVVLRRIYGDLQQALQQGLHDATGLPASPPSATWTPTAHAPEQRQTRAASSLSG